LNGQYRLPTSLCHVDDDIGPIDEDPHLKNLEIYVACLARLSDFKDARGNLLCLWEDARQHPKLKQSLIDKLVVLANPQNHFQVGLPVRSAATKVLKNFELDMEGNPGPPCALARSAAKASVMIMAVRSAFMFSNSQGEQARGDPELQNPVDPAMRRVEQVHSSGDSGEIEEVRREAREASHSSGEIEEIELEEMRPEARDMLQ
jgi:hypothetical protein